MNARTEDFETARDRHSSYGGRGINSSIVPAEEPSVLRDIKFGTQQLVHEFREKSWLEATGLFAFMLLLYGFSFIYGEIVYLASREKLHWTWSKTGGQRPPRWHHYYAFPLAVVWGVVFSIPSLATAALITTFRRIF